MRQRWFGAYGLRVPEIAVEGEDIELLEGSVAQLGDETFDILLADDVEDRVRLHDAHEAGLAVVVRAGTPAEVRDALAHPEVACVVVPASARGLRELDLTQLTYG